MVRLLLFALWLPACGLAGTGPEEAARTYLETAATPDDEAVKRLVEPRCHERPVGRGGPARVLGVPMKLAKVDVRLEQHSGDRAVVHYALEGAVEARKTKTKTKILGAEVEIAIDGLSVGALTTSGTLQLHRVGRTWLVSCAEP